MGRAIRPLWIRLTAPHERRAGRCPQFMVFASPIFLLLFLPVVFAAYAVAPRVARNPVLLVASVVVLHVGRRLVRRPRPGLGPRQLGLRTRDRQRGPDPLTRRRWLTAAVVAQPADARGLQIRELRRGERERDGVGPWDAIASSGTTSRCRSASRSSRSTRSRTWSTCTRGTPGPSAGCSTLRSTSCSFRSSSPDPIIRWRDFTDQIAGRDWRTADVAYGLRRLLLGLGKKVLIANTLGRVGRCRSSRLPPRQLHHGARLAGPRLLHAADLFRLLRLLGHGARPDAAVRLPDPRELQLSLRLAIDPRVLAALAYLAVELVPRLPVRPARRQPPRHRHAPTGISSSCSCCADSGTAPAGPSSCGASGTGSSWSRNAPASDALLERTRTASRHVYTLAGRDGRMGAVPSSTLERAIAFYRALLGLGEPAIRCSVRSASSSIRWWRRRSSIAVVGATPVPARLGAWLEQLATRRPRVGISC